MADKLYYIYIDDKQNHPYCRLQLVVKTFLYSTKGKKTIKVKVLKVDKLTNKKTLL